MWSNLPFDVLANIFSFLSPDYLASADSACRNWHACARGAYPLPARTQPAWFVAMPSRTTREPPCYYCHNPNTNAWHTIHLDGVIHEPVRPVASIGGLLLLRPTASHLYLCNPFTRRVKQLPMFNRARTNPALGIVVSDSPNFKVYLAGGMSEAPCGSGASYEATLEMYDSGGDDKWRVVGSVPMELAVRLTVWTPNESVYSEGVLYWMTSARAYTIMGFDIGEDRWHELSVPLADRLEFAALVQREGKLVLVGAVCGEEPACVWELGTGGVWRVIEKVPAELGRRLVGDAKLSWGNTKCVGIDGAICLYRDLGSGMVVWREMEMEEKGRRRRYWQWQWVEGCSAIKGKRVHNFAVRGLLLQPNCVPSCFLN